MKNYKKNIKLDYIHTFIRNTNLTHAVWIAFLLFKGFSLIEVGILEAVFHITGLTMEVPTGIVADVFGRKRSRSIGIVLYLIYIAIMVLSSNFILMIIGFIICGLSFTFESGSGEALVYDSLKLINEEDRFMKVNGNKEVIYQLASTVGLALGGYFSVVYFELPFLFTGVIFLLALLVIISMVETPFEKPDKEKKFRELMSEHYIKTTGIVMANKRLLMLIVIGALFFAPVTSIFMYFQGYIEDLEYTRTTLGLLLAGHSVMGALGGYFAFKIEKKLKEKVILYFVPFLITLSLWIVLIDSIVFIPFILLGFFDSMMYVVLGDYINRLIPSEVRASVLSVSGFAFSVVMIILFPIIGLFGHFINLKTGFLFLAIIVSIFNVILIFILKGNHLEHKET